MRLVKNIFITIFTCVFLVQGIRGIVFNSIFIAKDCLKLANTEYSQKKIAKQNREMIKKIKKIQAQDLNEAQAVKLREELNMISNPEHSVLVQYNN